MEETKKIYCLQTHPQDERGAGPGGIYRRGRQGASSLSGEAVVRIFGIGGVV